MSKPLVCMDDSILLSARKLCNIKLSAKKVFDTELSATELSDRNKIQYIQQLIKIIRQNQTE